MKKFVVLVWSILFLSSAAYSGENPKLFKEIQRKVKIDLSHLILKKSEVHYVIVKFQIINQEIDVIDIIGTEEELTDLMLCELKEMYIKTEAKEGEVFTYKFIFEQE